MGDKNILFQNCREDWPLGFCGFANVCGLISSAIWFVVLFPQLYLNFRRKSIAGVSWLWAIINFTASLNNLFFIFKLGGMPLYASISAAYMPILNFVILVQFWMYTSKSRIDLLIWGICGIVWIALIIAHFLFKIQSVAEWISITLWSIGTFPQVFLNMERGSTDGLSPIMITLTSIGKTSDFLGNYILIIPLQYVFMTYFSSTVAHIDTLQVIWNWNRVPYSSLPNEEDRLSVEGSTIEEAREEQHPKTEQLPISPSCNVLRVVLFSLLSLLLICFIIGLVWRTSTWASLLCPLGVVIVLVIGYCYYVLGYCKSFSGYAKTTANVKSDDA